MLIALVFGDGGVSPSMFCGGVVRRYGKIRTRCGGAQIRFAGQVLIIERSFQIMAKHGCSKTIVMPTVLFSRNSFRDNTAELAG